MNQKLRAAIYAGAILWIVAFFQIITTKYMVNEDGITQAFARNQMAVTKSSVELKVNLGQKTLDKEVIQKVFGSQVLATVHEKNGQNYAHIEASQPGDMEGLAEIYKKFGDMCKSNRLSDYELMISVEGSVAGRLTEREKESLCKSMEKTVGAVRVRTLNTDGYYVSYGYATGLDGSVLSGGIPSNLTIALTYDEGRPDEGYYGFAVNFRILIELFI